MFKKESFELFKKGLVQGIGWALGVTIGFAIVSTILAILIERAGGIPLIGSFIASIVEATQNAIRRN